MSGDIRIETSVAAVSALAPQPCDRRGRFQVALTNLGDKDTFVDAVFTTSRGLTLSREAWSTFLPAGDPPLQLATELRAIATRTTPPGRHRVRITVGGRQLDIPVTVTEAPGNGVDDNLALYRQAFASSTHANVTLCGGVDGNTDSGQWGDSGTHDATSGVFPDHYGVQLDAALPVGRVELYTLDSAKYPAAVMGVRDVDVQARVAGEWQTVAGVRGNEVGHLSFTFPAVIADQVRVVTLDSNDHKYSRIVELEVYQR